MTSHEKFFHILSLEVMKPLSSSFLHLSKYIVIYSKYRRRICSKGAQDFPVNGHSAGELENKQNDNRLILRQSQFFLFSLSPISVWTGLSDQVRAGGGDKGQSVCVGGGLCGGLYAEVRIWLSYFFKKNKLKANEMLRYFCKVLFFWKYLSFWFGVQLKFCFNDIITKCNNLD